MMHTTKIQPTNQDKVISLLNSLSRLGAPAEGHMVNSLLQWMLPLLKKKKKKYKPYNLGTGA